MNYCSSYTVCVCVCVCSLSFDFHLPVSLVGCICVSNNYSTLCRASVGSYHQLLDMSAERCLYTQLSCHHSYVPHIKLSRIDHIQLVYHC